MGAEKTWFEPEKLDAAPCTFRQYGLVPDLRLGQLQRQQCADTPYLQSMSPFLIVWMLYLLTSILTELVSNNAVAVVVTPLAISLSATLGIDPRPLIVAVMIAASASFATPIGYQTNMMVYGPGGYRFTDFLRVGLPLNLSVGVLASAIIPFIWPLQVGQ